MNKQALGFAIVAAAAFCGTALAEDETPPAAEAEASAEPAPEGEEPAPEGEAAAAATARPVGKAPTDVVVETSRQQYVSGDSVEIIVTNKRESPIFLSGCGSFAVQRFLDEQTYEGLPAEQCVSEGEAVEVAPGTYTLSWQAAGARAGGDILRIGLAFGWGCEGGRALTQARCRDFATVYSAPFRVGRSVDKNN